MYAVKALSNNGSGISGKVTKWLVLSQLLLTGLKITKVISNTKTKRVLRGLKNLPIKLKYMRIVARMRKHLSQSLLEAEYRIMVHKHMVTHDLPLN